MGIRVLVCAYRQWALDIARSLSYDHAIVSEPETLFERYLQYKPDIVVLLGWSWKVPGDIYNSCPTICLHPSPLPLYRGGSPLQHQIMRNRTESAVTFFMVDDGIDTGPILMQEKFSLDGNLSTIFKRITMIGKRLLKKILAQYPDFKTTPQQGKSTCYPRRKPEESELVPLDFQSSSAIEMYNFIRALGDPYPNAYIVCGDGQKLYFKEVSLGA